MIHSCNKAKNGLQYFCLFNLCIYLMANIFKIFQIVLAILLIVFILLQQRGSGLGMAFGGESNVFRSKRGIEKIIFYTTIIIAVLFCLTCALTVFLG